MKTTKFTLYGLLLGAVCAAYGSAIFALLLVIGFYGFDLLKANPFDMLINFVWATLFSAMFSAAPGAVGGLILARWMTKSDWTPKEIRTRGLIVGAVAGLIASGVVVIFVFQPIIDIVFLGYAALVTVISAGMSWLCAHLLAKDKQKFVSVEQQTLVH
jgi:hypothetical protein